MILYLKQLLNGKDQQSFSIRLNVIITFFFRGGGVLCSFLTVPLSLAYLDETDYGVWLTLSSVVSWLSFMDVGLGNGLRNKLTEAIAKGDKVVARQYTSTAYILFALLIIAVFLTFSVINPYLNWNGILNSKLGEGKLIALTYIVVGSFCLRIVLDLSGIIVTALHKPYVKSIVDLIINSLSLLAIFCLVKFSSPSLLLFGAIISAIPVLVLVGFTIYLFKWKPQYRFLAPSVSFFKKGHLKSLFSIGVQFFIIQIASLVIFSTDNILINQFFSPVEVTVFNIAYKYFSIVTFGFSILLLPYWSAFTAAFLRKDILWIEGAFKRLLFFWLLQIVAVIALVVGADYVYRMWVGDQVLVPNSVSMMLGVYTIVFNWNNIFAYFLNGVSKIRLQLWSSVFLGLLNIPLAYYLSKYTDLGVSSIVLANCICLLIAAVWSPIQCYKIITSRATGIWNK